MSINVGTAGIHALARGAMAINRILFDETLVYGKGAASDPHFDKVAILLGFDGNQGETEIHDESSFLRDISTLGNAHIDTSAFKFGTGALLLDGVGDYLTCPAATELRVSNAADKTYEAVINVSAFDTGAAQTIMDMRGVGATEDAREFVFHIWTNQTLQFVSWDSAGSVAVNLNPAKTLVAGTIYHVAVTREGGVWRLFIDGNLEASATESATPGSNSAVFNIGRSGSGAGARYFKGWMDELRVTHGLARYTANFAPPSAKFPRLQSLGDPNFASVVLLAGFDSSIVDESGTPKTLTANGNAQVSAAQSKFGGGALLLDGAGDYVSSPDNAAFTIGAGQFTVEAFANFSATSGFQTICSHYSALGQRAIVLDYRGDATTPFLRFVWADGAQTTFVLNSSAWTPVVGQWYHLAVDRDATHIRIYIDGVMVAKVADTTTIHNSTYQFMIGALESSGIRDFLNGYIDEFRFTNGVARYASDAGFAVPTKAYPRTAA